MSLIVCHVFTNDFFLERLDTRLLQSPHGCKTMKFCNLGSCKNYLGWCKIFVYIIILEEKKNVDALFGANLNNLCLIATPGPTDRLLAERPV